MHTNFEFEASPGQLKATLLGLGIQSTDRVRNGCPGKTTGIEKDAPLSQEQAGEKKTHQNARAHLRARLPFSSSALQPNPHPDPLFVPFTTPIPGTPSSEVNPQGSQDERFAKREGNVQQNPTSRSRGRPRFLFFKKKSTTARKSLGPALPWGPRRK